MRAFKVGTVFLIIAGVIAALAVTFHAKVVPVAKASQGCSVKTLRGNYGGVFTLLAFPGPTPASPQPITSFLPVNALEVGNWDGAGNFHSTITGSIGGQPAQTGSDSGTYTVNPNCTGSLAITSCIPGLGCVPLTFDFIIFHGGKEIRFIETDGSGVAAITETLMENEQEN
jgi:hypothetical protein